MLKLFVLTKTLLKETLNGFKFTKSKFVNMLLIGIIIITLIVPISVGMHFLIKDFLNQGNVQSILLMFLPLLIGLASFAILFFVFFQVPSMYLFQQENPRLLSYPISTPTLLTSKFILVLLFEYIVAGTFLIPVFINLLNQNFSLLNLFIYSVIFLVLPIAPVAISIIVPLLLLKIFPGLRNKNLLTFIISILAIALALGYQYINGHFISNTAPSFFDSLESLAQMFVKPFNLVLPYLSFFTKAIVNSSLFDLLIGCVIVSLYFIAYLLVGQFTFVDIVTSMKIGKTNNKKISDTIKSTSLYEEVFKRDLRNIFRNPSFALNHLVAVLIFPLITLIYIISGQFNLEEINNVLPTLYNFVNPLLLFSVAGFVLGFFISSTNSYSGTMISRELPQLDYIKTYPVRFIEIIKGKSLVSLLFMFLTIVINSTMISFLLKPSFIYVLTFVLCSLMASVFVNIFQCWLDLTRPNFKWTNEQQLVKNSLNVFIVTIGAMLIVVALVVVAYVLRNNPLVYLLSVLSVLVLLSVLLIYRINKLADRFLER